MTPAKQPNEDYDLEEVLAAKRLDGSLIRDKARVLTEDWLDKIYGRMALPDITTSTLLDIGKVLIEVGDLKPKKEVAQQSAGAGFSITINIPQTDGKPPITIEGHATPVSSDPDDMDDAIEGVQPTGFQVPDFTMNDDLITTTSIEV